MKYSIIATGYDHPQVRRNSGREFSNMHETILDESEITDSMREDGCLIITPIEDKKVKKGVK